MLRSVLRDEETVSLLLIDPRREMALRRLWRAPDRMRLMSVHPRNRFSRSSRTNHSQTTALGTRVGEPFVCGQSMASTQELEGGDDEGVRSDAGVREGAIIRLASGPGGGLGDAGWRGRPVAVERQVPAQPRHHRFVGRLYRCRTATRPSSARSEGGTAYSVNGDDGNLNFDKGIVQQHAQGHHRPRFRTSTGKHDFGVLRARQRVLRLRDRGGRLRADAPS